GGGPYARVYVQAEDGLRYDVSAVRVCEARWAAGLSRDETLGEGCKRGRQGARRGTNELPALRTSLKRRRGTKQNGAGLTPAPFGEVLGQEKLNGFCRRCARVSRCRFGKSTAAGFLLGTLVDLDGTFEIGAVLNHDARGRQVADHGAILLDFDAILGAHISLHVAIDHHFTGDHVGGHLRGGANGELPLVELDQSFDRAIDLQIFVACDFAFHVQAGPEPRSRTVRSRTQWTQSICTHGFFLPSRRSGLRRLIHL